MIYFRNNTKKIFAELLLSGLILVFLEVGTVFALDTSQGYVPLAPLPGTNCVAGVIGTPGVTDTNCPTTGVTLASYLTGIYKLGIGLAGVLAFLMVVWGGFTYLSTDSVMGKTEGKSYVVRALGGLLLALASYLVLVAINPNLVNLNLFFGPPAKSASLQNFLDVKNNALAQFTSNQDKINTELKNARASAEQSRASANGYRQNLIDSGLMAAYSLCTDTPEACQLSPEQVAQVRKQLADIDQLNQNADAQAAYEAGEASINNARNLIVAGQSASDILRITSQMRDRVNNNIVALRNINRPDLAVSLRQQANDQIKAICNKIPAAKSTAGAVVGATLGVGAATSYAVDAVKQATDCYNNYSI